MDRVKTLQQEIFNEIWAGAAAQNFLQSFGGEEGHCAYRGEDGRRCNVGLLIDDTNYTAEIEGDSVDAQKVFRLTKPYGRCVELGFDDDETAEVHGLLSSLQEDHDQSGGPGEHKLRLTVTAKDYKLEVPA